jgi:hypothetical protein
MAKRMATQFNVGDVVKWTSKFLKSTGQYTDVPKDGKVVRLSDMEDDGVYYPIVQWCDRPVGDVCAVNPHNVMHAKKPDYSGL